MNVIRRLAGSCRPWRGKVFRRRPGGRLRLVAVLGLAVLTAAAAGSCTRDESRVLANGRTKVRIGYIGITCEAPLFTAMEKGFFEEEGLDVEMVRCEWASL